MDEQSIAFSMATVALFKGIINREIYPRQWNIITAKQAQIEEYVEKLGLTLVLDETDGYAYLKQQTLTEDHLEIPRLIPRYPLSYQVSLLLVLLRKQLLEFDSQNNAERFIISKQEIVALLRPYLKEATNEAKQLKEIEANLNRIKDMGFIRALDGTDAQYEILRILRGYVDAQWLGEFDTRLQAYRAYTQESSGEEESKDESV